MSTSAPYRTPQRALRRWTELRAAQEDLVAALRPRIIRTEESTMDGLVLFELHLGPLADAGAADALCKKLRDRGLYCAQTIL